LPYAAHEGTAMNQATPTSSPSRFDLSKTTLLLLASVVMASALYLSPNAAAEKAVPLPAASQEVLAGVPPVTAPTETIVLAGGCFWGVQAVFQHTQGVLSAISGYAGGSLADADYEKVSSGDTGHAEAVQVVFDPRQVSYAQLLQIYFSIAHDPTQLNRQYPDTGTQYRSAVFYQDNGQKLVTERYIAQLDAAKVFPDKIVTQVSQLHGFYPAEKYHQNYATLHPNASYIARFDLPKLANLKSMMPALYREQPVLVQP
jgi:peptide-methionine (S)-S-oxide reductase